MKHNPLQTVVRHVRRFSGGAGGSSPDAELLAHYADRRDESAFEEIVRRHGPLVWALCRSTLQAADAEDAFQATFVVLARRAASIRKRASLACWLSGVARRVVRQLRRQATRRRTAELPVDAGAVTNLSPDRFEWRELLGEELQRLPEKYRLPIVLCYYQGLTNEEAAARLSWPPGTVCGRLARARETLRGRLARRGLTLSAGSLALQAVGPPSDVLAATFRVCAGTMGAGGVSAKLSGSVIALSTEVIRTMWLEKFRSWVMAIAIALVAGGTSVMLVRAAGQGTPPGVPPPAIVIGQPGAPIPSRKSPVAPNQPMSDEVVDAIKQKPFVPPAAGADELRNLRMQRYRSAHAEMTARLQAFQAGTTQGTIDILLACVVRRLLPSELALCDQPKDRLAAYKAALVILKWIESVNNDRFVKGRISIQDLEQTRFERLSMEIIVLEARAAANAPSDR